MSKFSNPSHPVSLMLFALSFSFLLMMVFSPMLDLSNLMKQWDFLLLWLISLMTIAVPMLYLELALAKRSQTTVLQGLMSLTRDADAKTTWRMMGWGGIFFISLLSGAILSQSAIHLQSAFNLQVHLSALIMGSAVVAIALSLLPRLFLVCLMIGAMVASLLIQPSSAITMAQWTNSSAQEWAVSVLMVVLVTGFGLNVYWQNSLKLIEKVSSLNIPVIALLASLFVAGVAYAVMPVQSTITLITIVAMLLQLAREQLQQKQVAKFLVWLLPITAILLWLVVPLHHSLNYVLMIVGLLLCLGYSIFVGWVMKASHLRKALNFNSELVYNLWRVAVRIVVPLQIIVALLVMLRYWFMP